MLVLTQICPPETNMPTGLRKYVQIAGYHVTRNDREGGSGKKTCAQIKRVNKVGKIQTNSCTHIPVLNQNWNE